MSITCIEGNTSNTKGLVANGGCVAEKSYADNYSKIATIYRPKYKAGEANKVIAEAKKYVGYLEKKSNSQLENFTGNAGFGNYNMFAPHAKSITGASIYVNGQPWCDMFVDDMFLRALGIERARELLGGWSAYTPTSANYLKQNGSKIVTPTDCKYGDIIFFKNSSRICHVGLVINGYIEKPATNKFIYTQAQFIEDVCRTLNVKTASAAFNKTLTLSEKKNPKNILVLYVQKRLKDLGYYTGTPDRDFGALTTKAVNAYQSKILKYKTTDGEITKKSKMWKSLLGL